MATWYSIADPAEPTDGELDRITGAWEDAPVDTPELLEVLAMLLEVAQEQVIDYGVQLGEGDPIPTRFVLAQLYHVKNLWTAGQVRSGGEFGEGGFSFVPRPLDKTVRSMIRPVDGKPHAL